MSYYCGIDLGGTNIKAGIVDGEGNLLNKLSIKTLAERSMEEIIHDMGQLAADAIKDAGLEVKDIECIGRTGLHKGDNIKLIVRRNGLERAVYVGDTERDMHAAHSAGLPFIHAAYGFGHGFDSEHSIASMRELPGLLIKIFKE